MVDPYTGGPEPHPTNTQENITNVVGDDHETQAVIDTSGSLNEKRKRIRSSNIFISADPAGRITIREIWIDCGTVLNFEMLTKTESIWSAVLNRSNLYNPLLLKKV